MSTAPVGTVLNETVYETAAVSSLDPRNAAARAIRAYLEQLVFTIAGKCKAEDVSFRLETVDMEWPDHHDGTQYPCASIIETPGQFAAHNLVPTPIEETYNQFMPGTVLWKTSELTIDFQVDFWTTNNPQRQAIAARLPAAFCPSEEQSDVLLSSGPEYFGRPVRCMMVTGERRDNSDDSFRRVKRFRCTISADIESVHLRYINQLTPQVTTTVETASGD